MTVMNNRYGDEFVTLGGGYSKSPWLVSYSSVDGDLPGVKSQDEMVGWATGWSVNTIAGAGLVGVGTTTSLSSGVTAHELVKIASPQAGVSGGYTWQTAWGTPTKPVMYCWNPHMYNSYSPERLERLRAENEKTK